MKRAWEAAAKLTNLTLSEWVEMKCDGKAEIPAVLTRRAAVNMPKVEMNGNKPFVCLLK